MTHSSEYLIQLATDVMTAIDKAPAVHRELTRAVAMDASELVRRQAAGHIVTEEDVAQVRAQAMHLDGAEKTLVLDAVLTAIGKRARTLLVAALL